MEAFGWPTAVNPVSVAIARLHPENAVSVPPVAIAAPTKERRSFSSLALSQQVGIRCNEPAFWQFINELCEQEDGVESSEGAASFVRALIGVTSRAGHASCARISGFKAELDRISAINGSMASEADVLVATDSSAQQLRLLDMQEVRCACGILNWAATDIASNGSDQQRRFAFSLRLMRLTAAWERYCASFSTPESSNVS